MSNQAINNSIFPPASSLIISGGTFISNSNQIHGNGLKGGFDRLLEAVAPNALHNSGHDCDAPKCHPGTRVAVIQAIMDWAAGIHDNPGRKDIAWVTGAAGAGKSAIGRSVCERCAQEGSLLGSFFFGSNDATRNHSRSLVATIVYQLCLASRVIRQTVTNIIDNDPLILKTSLREQLSTLLVAPLMSAFVNNPLLAPCVIVIDGIDECKNHSSQLEVLDSLLWLSNICPIPIRVLVCTRSESQIINFFSPLHIQDVVFKIFLGDEYSPDQDIRLYLSDRFKAIKENHVFRTSIPDTWPTVYHMNQIVYKSSGQFIYAATIILYVESPRHRPHQRLESALGLSPPFKDLPFSYLDALYMHILDESDNPQVLADLLTFIIRYETIFTLRYAEQILQIDAGDAEVLLMQCTSIVDTRECDIKCPRLLHKSFADFLLDSSRSKEFSRNLKVADARYILRMLDIYSGNCEGTRLNSIQVAPCSILTCLLVSQSDWVDPIYQEAVYAMAQFPMKNFCKLYFPSNIYYGGSQFLRLFLYHCVESENPVLLDAYTYHVKALFECSLEGLNEKGYDAWQRNHALAMCHIHIKKRELQNKPNDHMVSALELVRDISMEYGQEHQCLAETNKGQILSKASAYCVQHLSSKDFKIRKEEYGFIQIAGASRRRKLRPWNWHRTFRHRVRVGKLIFAEFPEKYYFTLCTFAKLGSMEEKMKQEPYSVCSVELANWSNSRQPRGPMSEYPYFYMCYLEYLIEILPLSDLYPPLIDMCRTKTFSPLSMAFPSLSRRARSVIRDYLERADAAVPLLSGQNEFRRDNHA